jgi:hypothetical protein
MVSTIQEVDPIAEAGSTQNSANVFQHRPSEDYQILSPSQKVADGVRVSRPSLIQSQESQEKHI